MGQRRKNREAFLENHPWCCLCGGEVQATTIEHAPAKILFWESRRPKGLEVPACGRCNTSSSQSDQIVALVSCVQSAKSLRHGDADQMRSAHIKKLIDGVGNNAKASIFNSNGRSKWITVEGVLRRYPEVQIKPECQRDYLDPWAAKQALAVWYDTLKKAVPAGSKIFVNWFSPQFLNSSKRVRDFVVSLPQIKEVSMGSWKTDDQYFCRFGITDDQRAGIFWCALHQSHSFMVVVDTDGLLSADLESEFLANAAQLSTDRFIGIHIVPNLVL